MTTAATTSPAPLGLRPAASTPARAAAPAPRDGARGLAALLLAAVVSAMVVLADRLVSTWADGHLLLAWVLLWLIVFAGLALFAGTARRVARQALSGLDSWSARRAEVRAEARLWEIARTDPRVMAELTLARDLAEREADTTTAPVAGPVAAAAPVSYWEQLGRARARRSLMYPV